MLRISIEPQQPERATVSQPALIACVDDDVSVREALAGLLLASGFAAEAFSAAEDFLRSGPLERFSCLITDLRLGGISGLGLRQQMVRAGRDIPTIIITAYANDEVRAEASTAGVLNVLVKPVSEHVLMTCIGAALKLHEDHQEPGGR